MKSLESKLLIINSPRLRNINLGVLRLLLIILYGYLITLWIALITLIVEGLSRVANDSTVYANLFGLKSLDLRTPFEVLAFYIFSGLAASIIIFSSFWFVVRIVVWISDGFSHKQ